MPLRVSALIRCAILDFTLATGPGLGTEDRNPCFPETHSPVRLWGKDMELVPEGGKCRAPQELLVIAKGCIPESLLEEVVAELSLAQGTCSITSTVVVIHSRSKGSCQQGNYEWKTNPTSRKSWEKRQAVLRGRKRGGGTMGEGETRERIQEPP